MVASGEVGASEGFFWSQNIPAAGDIDADNDGVIVPQHIFTVDLSKVAARALGYQASMMAGYKIHRIKIGIRPVDDLDDNDAYASFGFDWRMFPCTEHAKTALQLARRIEKANEADQVDADSLFIRTEDRYTGFRYGWNDQQAVHPEFLTGNGIAGMPDDWYLKDIFDAYDQMTDEGKGRALFGGRAPEIMHMQQLASWTSGVESDASILDTHGMSQGNDPQDTETMCNLKVLPLLVCAVKYSTGDEVGIVDDDYTVHAEIEFTPEYGGVF